MVSFPRPPQQAGQHREKCRSDSRGDRPCLCQRAFPAEAAIGETRSERRLCGAATRLDDVARDSTETDVKQARTARPGARYSESNLQRESAAPGGPHHAGCPPMRSLNAARHIVTECGFRTDPAWPQRLCTSGPIRAELHGCVPQSGAGADAETLSQRPYSRCAQWRASSPLPRTGHARVDSLAGP